MIKWRFGAIFGILFLILIMKKLFNAVNLNSQKHAEYRGKRIGREMQQVTDSSTLLGSLLVTETESSYEDDVLQQKTFSNKASRDHKHFVTIRDWMADREGLYEERRRVVSRACQRYNVAANTSHSAITDFINKQTKIDKNHYVERIKLSQFYLSRPHQAMGCFINKVASSSLVRTLLLIDGYDVKHINSPHGYSNRLHPKTWSEYNFAKDHYLKFMLVREPLERLASCYMDKMVANTHWSLAALRKQIKNKFPEKTDAFKSRSKRQAESSSGSGLSINSDLTSGQTAKSLDGGLSDDSIMVNAENMEDSANLPLPLQSNKDKDNNGHSVETTDFSSENIKQDSKQAANSSELLAAEKKVKAPKRLKIYPKAEDIPSFSQFLQFVLSTNLLGSGFESHWVPYWRACTPCHFQYDVIAKLETGEDDFTYMWKKTKIDREAPVPWENKSGDVSERGKQLEELFRGVDRDLLIEVYRRYQLDYMMFGYDFNDVLGKAGYTLMSRDELERV